MIEMEKYRISSNVSKWSCAASTEIKSASQQYPIFVKYSIRLQGKRDKLLQREGHILMIKADNELRLSDAAQHVTMID